MNLRRTRLWQLPSGDTVRVWEDDVEALRRDVMLTGNVFLIRNPDSAVYDRVAPDSIEATEMGPIARRIDG
jgi:hypothetical protein